MTVAWAMASGTKRELRSAVSNHREGTLPGNSSLSTESLYSNKFRAATNFELNILGPRPLSISRTSKEAREECSLEQNIHVSVK